MDFSCSLSFQRLVYAASLNRYDIIICMHYLDKFIAKANIINYYKYSYHFVKYIGSKSKISIYCPVEGHGIFKQRADSHLNGSGCPKCSGKLKTSKQFEIEARYVHGDKYIYTDVYYINASGKVNIICKLHGPFKQSPHGHLSGKGCSKCGRRAAKIIRKPYLDINTVAKNICIRKTNDIFKAEAILIHGNRYDYTSVNYISAHVKIIIICIKHGPFEQTPSSHLNGRGCGKCSGKTRKTNEQFKCEAKTLYGDLYIYDFVNYISLKNKVAIICRKHGPFQQIPSNHLRGKGCPKCAHIISKPETAWLDSLNIDQKYRQAKIKINGRAMKTDAYVPDTNTIYEFHGNYWHGNPRLFKSKDINKRSKKTFGELYQKTLERENLIRNAGYNLIVMWEDDFRLLAKNNTIKFDYILEMYNDFNSLIEKLEMHQTFS